eukprot:COSAG05_NODE_22_length_32312_cov_23.410890_19_plen_60_part_00
MTTVAWQWPTGWSRRLRLRVAKTVEEKRLSALAPAEHGSILLGWVLRPGPTSKQLIIYL